MVIFIFYFVKIRYMDFNWKVITFLLILAGIVWINYRFSNIITRGYNFFSQFPKLILTGMGIIVIVAPFLLKDNPLVDQIKNFLPGNISDKIDTINELRKYNNQPRQNIPKKITGTTRDRRNVPEQLKKAIAAEQAWKCRRCGNMLDAKYEVDHIIALEDNGDNSIQNLQALCRNCHGKKTLSDDLKRKYPGGRI